MDHVRTGLLFRDRNKSTPELELDYQVFGVFGKVRVGQLGLFESYKVGDQLLDISQSWS